MSPYLVAFMIPSTMTSCVAPCFEIPPHTWSLGGCLCLYFSFLGVFFFRKHFLRWHSSCTVDSSVNIIKSFLFLHSFVTPVQSLHLVGILNRLAVLSCSVGPSEVISQSCNSSDTVLHFVHTKSLTRMSFRSDAVNSSFSAMASSVHRRWTSGTFYGGPLLGQSLTLPVFLHLLTVALMVWRVVRIPSTARILSSSVNVIFSSD